MDLFSELEIPEPRTLSELIAVKDTRGVIDLLHSLSNKHFEEVVLMAGLSTIGHHHGKPAKIDHVVRQIQRV